MNVLDIVLWLVQGFLALFFLAAGTPKLIGRGMEAWTGFAELARPVVILIGVAEVLGAAALILPMATGILPSLTPLAALGLAIIVLMAAGFHVREGEGLPAVETVLWAAIACSVAIGRWHLIPTDVGVVPWVLVVTLGLLVPAVIDNLVVLFRRTAASDGQVVELDR